jgi:hypothetical protein
MDMFRNSAGFEQKLLVTFRARSLDLRDIAEDVAAAAPLARFRCSGAQAEAGARPEVVDVGIELPDDAALLNSAMRVIFHAQGNLQPMIKVQRVLSERMPAPADKALPCASWGAAAMPAVAAAA